MDGWESGSVAANGLQLHYTRTGGAKQPLVLLHGISDDGPCWAPVAASLAPDHDVVMPDARGHGRSDAPPAGYGPAEQAADVAALVAALGLRRPVVLGHSMGAGTALALAGTHPDLPAAILLEDPPAWWLAPAGGSPLDDDRRAGLRAWLADIKRKTRDDLLAEGRAGSPGWTDAELQPWADAKHRMSPHVERALAPGDAAPVAWSAVLARIACPALLVTADPALGAILTAEDAASLRALVPGLRVAHVPGAGHSVRRDQPARYLEVVRAFLAETRT